MRNTISVKPEANPGEAPAYRTVACCGEDDPDAKALTLIWHCELHELLALVVISPAVTGRFPVPLAQIVTALPGAARFEGELTVPSWFSAAALPSAFVNICGNARSGTSGNEGLIVPALVIDIATGPFSAGRIAFICESETYSRDALPGPVPWPEKETCTPPRLVGRAPETAVAATATAGPMCGP